MRKPGLGCEVDLSTLSTGPQVRLKVGLFYGDYGIVAREVNGNGECTAADVEVTAIGEGIVERGTVGGAVVHTPVIVDADLPFGIVGRHGDGAGPGAEVSRRSEVLLSAQLLKPPIAPSEVTGIIW